MDYAKLVVAWWAHQQTLSKVIKRPHNLPVAGFFNVLAYRIITLHNLRYIFIQHTCKTQKSLSSFILNSLKGFFDRIFLSR